MQIGELGVKFSESIILFLSKGEPGALMPVHTRTPQDYFPKYLPPLFLKFTIHIYKIHLQRKRFK